MDAVMWLYLAAVICLVALLYLIRHCDIPNHWTSRWYKYRLDMILLLIVDVVLLIMAPLVSGYQRYHHLLP